MVLRGQEREEADEDGPVMLIATFVRILEEGGEEGGRGGAAVDFNRPLKSLNHDRRLNAD